MEKAFRVEVFGKEGCDKCKVLNQRLDALLAKDEWADYEKVYCDVGTLDGLVRFCRAECVNPSRIPAFRVLKHDPRTQQYVPVPNLNPEKKDAVLKHAALFAVVGLQTDYTETGRGVITPKMVAKALAQARSQ